VPAIVRPVLQYVTPALLGLILLGFSWQTLPDVIGSGGTTTWIARGLLVGVFAGIALLVRFALGGARTEEA
jgi:hypothetical protein